MILQLYDLNHTRIAGLKNFKDAMVESELSTGDKTLSFLWHQSNRQMIPQEYYIRTDSDEFVIKENSKASGGYRKIVAKLNIEEIEGRTWSEFIIDGCTAKEAADYALTDTGWSCISTIPAEKLRKISLKKVSSFQVLERILEAFTCEIKFDTFLKIVYLKEQVGEDKGVYFIDGLNLKEITDSSDSYDYATIIIPIGADGLEITEINGGNNYLENYQYSNKKKSVIWEDSSYTDAEALMEDAAYRLNEISKPKVTYRAKTIDLAKMNSKYSALAYSVGDTATFISNKDGIREKQRITKTVEYINNPQKNTCDISNTVLSFEEMQKKLFAAAECISNITTDNGTVNGSAIDKVDVTQIIGLEHYISEDVDEIKVNYLYVRTEFGTPYAVIGEGVFTSVRATNLNVNSRADINTAYINVLNVNEFTGDTASFKTIESDNIAALEARLDKITSTEITVEYLEANYAQVNFSNVGNEYVKNLFTDIGLITDATIVDGHITGNLDSVNINANLITTGTLAVDRLIIRGSEDSLIYELNNITGALQAVNANTLNGEVITPRTINCDRLVAESITANEIAAESITASKIAVGAIETGKIAANAITAAKIASGAITTEKLAAKAITAKKIDVEDLFSQNITATGTITGVTLKGVQGEIAGFTIKEDRLSAGTVELYSGTSLNGGNLTVTGGIEFPNGRAIYAGTGVILQENGKATGAFRMQKGENGYYAEIRAGDYFFRGKDGFANLGTIWENNEALSDKYASISHTHTSIDGASKYLARSGNTSYPMTFNWLGQGGQPTWLWGGEDGTNMYVYNPANFSVSYAANAGYLKYNGYTIANGAGDGNNFGMSNNASQATGVTLTRLRGSNVRIYSHSGGGVYLGNSGSTVITSDENLKDLYNIDNRYEQFFEELNPTLYIYKNRGHRKHIGFGARAVAKALSNAELTTEEFAGVLIDKDVTICADEAGELTDMHYDEMYSLRYEEFIALNTYMIQKLMRRMAELETRLEVSQTA